MIVVDTLARYSEGVEENSATDMGRVISVVDELTKNLRATVIWSTHHPRLRPCARVQLHPGRAGDRALRPPDQGHDRRYQGH